MKYSIIHIFLPMMLGLACTVSCTSDRYSPDILSEEEMTFEVGNLTRASITTDKNLKTKPFMLFGDVYRKAEFYPGLKEIFNGQTVAFQSDKWDYGPARYWFMGQEHSFVAVHPAFIQEIPEGITYSDSEISFTYETPVSDYKSTTDILVATHRRIYTMDNAGEIRFAFKHVLSRIDIAPALHEALMYDDNPELKISDSLYKDEYIQIHKIELHGLKTKASFSFAPTPLPAGESQTDERTETYEVYDDSVKPIVLNFPDETPKVTNNSTNVSVFNDNNPLLMLPQRIGDDTEAVLYYTINGDHTEGEPVRTATISLTGIGEWKVGKIYTYKFTIEKAYTGQVKPGSLTWTVKDIADPDTGDKWIAGDETITQDFDINDDQ